MSGAIFVPVWPTWSVCGRQPAHGHRPRAPDGRAEQPGQLLDRREALRRARAAAAARRPPWRRPARRHPRSAWICSRHAHHQVGLAELGGERPRPPPRRRRLVAATACGATVEQRRGAVQRRLLEQAAAPAHAGQRDGVAGGRRDAVGRQRLVEACAPTCASTSLPRSVPAATTADGDSSLDELGRQRAQASGAYPSRRARPRGRRRRPPSAAAAAAPIATACTIAAPAPRAKAAPAATARRGCPSSCSTSTRIIDATPSRLQQLDHRGRRRRAVAEDLGLLALALGERRAAASRAAAGRVGGCGSSGFLRPHPARHGRDSAAG